MGQEPVAQGLRGWLRRQLGTRRRRATAAASVVLVLILIVAQFGPSVLLGYLIRRGLGDLGLIGIELGTAELSLVRGRLVVRQVAASPPAGPLAEIKGLSIRLAWLPIVFQHRLAIEGLELDGLSLSLERTGKDEYAIRGLPPLQFPAGGSNDAASGWTFGIEDLRLTNSTIRLDGPAGALNLALSELRVKSLNSWDRVSPTLISLAAQIGDAPVRIDGSLHMFAPQPEVSLQVKTSGLDVPGLLRVFERESPELAGFMGRLEADLSLAGRMPAPDKTSLGFEGRAEGRLAIDRLGASPARDASAFGSAEASGTFALDGRTLRHQGGLSVKALALRLDGLRIDGTGANWTGTLETSLDGGAISAKGKAELGPMAATLSGDAAQGSAQLRDFRFDGRLAFSDGKAEAEGAVSLAGAEWREAGRSLRLGAAQLAGLRVEAEPKAQPNIALRASGDVTLDDLGMDQADIAANLRSLSFAGSLASETTGTMEARGNLRIDGGRMLLQQVWRAQWGSMTLAGTASLSEGKAEAQMAQVKLDDASVGHEREGFDLIGLGQLEAKDLRLAATGNTEVAHLDVRQLRALQRQRASGAHRPYPWRFAVETLGLSALRFDPAPAARGGRPGANVSVEAIKAQDARISLLRRKEGLAGHDIRDLLAGGAKGGASGRAVAKPQTGGPSTGAKAESAFHFEIGRVDVGGDSRVTFIDETLPGRPLWRAQPVSLSVRSLGNTNLSRPAAFDLAARLGEFETVMVKGEAAPFGAKLNLDANAEVRRVDLSPLSPYLLDALGVAVRTGAADVDAKARITDDVLDGEARFRFSRLFIEESSAGTSDLAKRTGMPVSRILDLLRDSTDVISLRIPVTGSLDDPKFDLGDAVAQAIGGAVRSTASAMLRLAFPLLIIADVLDSDGKEALKPIDFEPGEEQFGREQAQYLAEVSRLLKERKSLTLEICGTAAAADWPSLAERRRQQERDEAERGFIGGFRAIARIARERLGQAEEGATMPPPDERRLLAVATRRAEIVRSYLASDLGIDPGRLFECRPVVRLDAAAKPQVELRF